MADFELSQLGYIGLNTPNLDRTAAFYQEVLGLDETERSDGRVYMRSYEEHHPDRHHALVLYDADESEYHHMAYEVVEPDEVKRAAEHLDSHGVDVEVDTFEAGQGEAVRFENPAGFMVEIYSGREMDRVDEPHPPAVFRPRYLEHLTYRVTDDEYEEMKDFYINVLDHHLSDEVGNDEIGNVMAFTRYGDDHHGVAMVNSEETKLHHYAWHILDWSSFREIADHLKENDVRIEFGPGRHGPGNNLFCYFPDVDGIRVELSTDIQQIVDDESWEPGSWSADPSFVNIWGPEPNPEFL